MAILGNQGVYVVVSSLLSGQVMQNVMYYHAAVTGEGATPDAIADYWETDILPVWQDVLSDAVPIIGLSVQTTIGTGVPPYPPALRTPNAYGTIVSEPLPPHVCARLYKTPDIGTEEPSAPPNPWRLGMTRISGVPESYQDSGILDSTYVALLQLLADELPAWTIGTVDYAMHIVRPVGSPPSITYYVVEISSMTASGILGSQNTRKISL